MMACYVCNKQSRETPAVAICTVCGMALCAEHAIREELPVYETVETGMTATRHKLPSGVPRIVCPECHKAVHQAR
jgi:hypothetical protein